MRLAVLAALLVPALALASQEPPPVVLSHSVTGSVRVAHPFLVNLKVASVAGETLAGHVKVVAAPALSANTLAADVQLAPRSGGALAIPVTAHAAGLHELDLQWMADDLHPALATLRLFVRVPVEGEGRVLTLADILASEAVSRDADQPRTFPLVRQGLLEAAPAKVITGQLFFHAYGGGDLPARRVTAELYREKGKKRELVETTTVDREGRFSFPLPTDAASAKLVPVFSLATPRWNISDGSKTYAWEAPALDHVEGGQDIGTLSFPQGQVAAEAIWIHNDLNRALDFWEASGVDLSWWTSIPVTYPGSGDYFSWDTVNLTKPFQWDVTLHEFGHAIFHYGSSATGAGGSHKIDECYSKGLAWSEGWASWHAAVVHEARDSEDAKFEFMVPRRAPIRVENVPADVCHGDANEWRVTAALWDVYDTHVDADDSCAVDFATMWGAMREGHHVGEIKKYIDVLRPHLDAATQAAMDKALKQNTIGE